MHERSDEKSRRKTWREACMFGEKDSQFNLFHSLLSFVVVDVVELSAKKIVLIIN